MTLLFLEGLLYPRAKLLMEIIVSSKPALALRLKKCTTIHTMKNNADLLPPVVAMHACIVFGLCEHDTPTACDVESRRC
jgi:hypothetical protein